MNPLNVCSWNTTYSYTVNILKLNVTKRDNAILFNIILHTLSPPSLTRSILYIDIYSIADFAHEYRTIWKVAWRCRGISWFWIGQKKSRVNWAQRDWELGELARRTRPILKWVSLTVPCIVLGHQRVGSCRTPEDRKELLCWRKESVGGFKADKETGRRSGPKQHEYRVSGLSKGWGSPIDRASRPWGIFCGKKG